MKIIVVLTILFGSIISQEFTIVQKKLSENQCYIDNKNTVNSLLNDFQNKYKADATLLKPYEYFKISNSEHTLYAVLVLSNSSNESNKVIVIVGKGSLETAQDCVSIYIDEAVLKVNSELSNAEFITKLDDAQLLSKECKIPE